VDWPCNATDDTAIRRAEPAERDDKMADGGGLSLLVTTAGGQLWRLKYRSLGIERKLWLGTYPDVPLGETRKARDAARTKLGAGVDPSDDKRRERVANRLSAATTFGDVALEYIDKEERQGHAGPTITADSDGAIAR
jgi:hypothetical protein